MKKTNTGDLADDNRAVRIISPKNKKSPGNALTGTGQVNTETPSIGSAQAVTGAEPINPTRAAAGTEPISSAQADFLKKMKGHRYLVRAARVLCLLVLLLLWEWTARNGIINAFIFSSPDRILTCGLDLLRQGSLISHISVTLGETLASFLLVGLSSLLAAIILWWTRTLSEILEPWLVVLNSLPKSAMAPIFIVWIGSNIKTIIVTAISVAVFGSILNLYTAFSSTDPDKLKLIRTLGGSRTDCLIHVVLPMNLPSILSTMKVDIGLCLIGVVIGEFLAARRGLGYLIIYGSQVLQMECF